MNIANTLKKWNTWKVLRWTPGYKIAEQKVHSVANDLVNEGLHYGLVCKEADIVEVIYELCKQSSYDIYTSAIKVEDVLQLQFQTLDAVDLNAVRAFYKLPSKKISVPVFTGER